MCIKEQTARRHMPNAGREVPTSPQLFGRARYVGQVRGAHFYEAQTFPELARKAVGPAHGRLASTMLGFALTFFVFGSLVAYQVVAGDVFPAICEQLVDGHPTQLCSRSVMILLSACLLSLPICLGARSLAALSGARLPRAFSSAKLIGRCSDGVEDHGADGSVARGQENHYVRFGSRLPRERLSFQRWALSVCVCVCARPVPAFSRLSRLISRGGSDRHTAP